MRKRRAKPGDFFEVRTPKGVGYIRFLGRHPGPLPMDAFAVLENPDWGEVSERDLPALKVRYHFGSSARYLPHYNSNFTLIPGPKGAEVSVPSTWRYSQMKGWRMVVDGVVGPLREIDSDMARIPIIKILPGNLIEDRMFSGWTPEDELKDAATRFSDALTNSSASGNRKEFTVFLEFSGEKEARECMRYLRGGGYDVKLGKDKQSLTVTSYPDRSEGDWIDAAEKAIMRIAEQHGARYVGNEAEL